MERPSFSFPPPAPFSSDVAKQILERLEALEREIMLLKRKLSEIEGRGVRTDLNVPSNVAVSRPVPATELKERLLEHVDLGNVRVIETLLEWTQFLLSKVGQEGIADVVDYYVDIGWISEEVAGILLRYAQGIRVESSQGYMLPEDHAKSLDYISRIKEAMR